MKIAEYNEMMAYLTRPEPQPTINRDNFAIGGGMIEGEDLGTREGFKVIKLTERYVDKPGKGFFKNKLASEIPLETLEKIPGFIRTTTEGVVFDTLKNAENFSKSDVVKDFKKSRMESRQTASSISRRMENRNPDLFNKIIELAEEGKTSVLNIGKHPEVLKLNEGKTVDYDNIRQIVTRTKGKEFFDTMKDVKQYYKSPTRIFLEENLDNLMNDYYDGMSTTKLTKKYLPDSSDAVKNISNTTLSEIINENKDPEKFIDRPIIVGSNQTGSRKEQIENLNDFQKYLSKNINKFSSKAEATQNLKDLFDGSKIDTLGNFISKTNILRRMYNSKDLPKNFKINENVKNLIKYLPAQDFIESELRALGYSEKTIKSMKSVENAVSNVTEAQTMFEHALPRSLIKSFNLPKKYNLTGERTSNFLNKFKMQFDGQLKNAAMAYAESNQTPEDYKKYKNKVKNIRNTVSKLTGGYEIGYVDFDKNGKAIPVTPQSSMLKGEGELGKRTTGIKNFFKNIQFHNNLYKNYKKNPNDKNFYSLKDEIKNSEVSFVPEPEIEKEYNKIKNFNTINEFQNYFNKAPESSFFKSLFKGKGGKIGLASAIAAGGATLPTLLSAEEPTLGMSAEGKETSALLPGAVAAGTAGTGYALRKPLTKFGKYALQVAGTPLGATGLIAGFGVDPTQTLDRVGIEAEAALAPSLVKGTEQITKNKILQRILNLGLSPARAMSIARVAQPIGVASLIGEGLYELGKRGVAEKAKLDAMTPEEKQSYLASEVEPLMDEGGMVDIGREGFADGPEDPGKRKFMKIMGGLASLPIVGKFIEPAAKVAPAALEVAKGMPAWFGSLVDKVIKEGIDVTKQFATKDREVVHVKQLGEAEGVRVTQDLETGAVRVDYDSPTNMGEQSVSFTYRPETQLEEGKTVPAQFEAVEAEPRGIRMGPDDYDIEFDGENIVESADELMSDTSSLKQFATGKLDEMDLKIRQDKLKKVQDLNENQMSQAEYLETKYGPGDDVSYKQFPDDD